MSEDLLTVPYQSAAAWRLHEGESHLNALDAASVSIALDGIQAITGILLQHEIDTKCDSPDRLRLGNATLTGLLGAVASCAEMIEMKVGAGADRATRARNGGAK